MKIKIVILSIMLIFLSGCTVDYNLEINDNQIKEETIMYEDSNDKMDDEAINDDFKTAYPIYIDEDYVYYDPFTEQDGYEYYDKSMDKKNNLYVANYKAEYSLSDFKRSRLINMSFKEFNVSLNDNEKFVSTSTGLNFFDSYNNINQIDININVNNYTVTSNNADEINGNTYIWHFNKDNYNDKHIDLFFTKDLANNNSDNKSTSSTDQTNTLSKDQQLIYALIAVLAFIIAIVVFVQIKRKKL